MSGSTNTTYGQFTPFTMRLQGRILSFTRPAVMGIVNVTPDSFYSGSRTEAIDDVARRVRTLIDEGADIIDIGAYSSRPGADDVSPDEELRRLELGISTIRSISTDIPVSVDTFRAEVARHAVTTLGADIVNDISGGNLDDEMLDTICRLQVPYILMHMRGTPSTMQQLTDYSPDVTTALISELSHPLHRLLQAGVADVIIDPGFGFAKTLQQNYELLRNLPVIARLLHRPVLVGVSRKSMITRPLGITPDRALSATTALHIEAISRGASILRVHDVAQARQAIEIHRLTTNPSPEQR